MNTDMKIKVVAFSRLTAWDRNPRIIHPEAEAALQASLERFGYVEPIVVNEERGKLRVVSGHQRLRILEASGATSARVVVLKLPRREASALAVTLNNPAVRGEFTNDVVALLEELRTDLGAEAAFGLGLEELYAEVAGAPEPDPKADEAPKPPKKARSRPGDLYIMGEHRLLCGDSTDAKDVARLMDGERAALLATDPPYGVSYADKNEFLNTYDKGNRIQNKIEGDHQTTGEMSHFWRKAFTTVRPFLVDGASYYVTGPQGGDLLLLLLLLLALKDAAFPLRHMLIWAKNNHVLGRCDYHYKHEPIIFGWVEGTHSFYGEPGETSLWQIDRPHASKLHPTMKPVELYSRAMRNSTKRGEVCLEPFSGSGSQLIAAEELGRRCFAIELDPIYVDVAVKRWEKFTGKKATRERTS